MQALRIVRLAHFLIIILNCTTSISVSFLHFGQNRGKLTRTVSWYTLLRVLPPHEGQCIHLDFCCFFCKCTSPLSLCAALRLSDWLLRITFYLNNYMVGLVNPIFVIFYCFAKNECVYTMTLSNRSPNRLKISLGIVPAHSATWAAVISKSPFFPITIALSPGDT